MTKRIWASPIRFPSIRGLASASNATFLLLACGGLNISDYIEVPRIEDDLVRIDKFAGAEFGGLFTLELDGDTTVAWFKPL